MNIEEGNKRIAITVCSGVCDGGELLKHDPEITGIETLVGYSTIQKVREEQQVGAIDMIKRDEKVLAEEDEPII
ncbi:MAG: hypothetical protein Q4D02_00540 [Clostridia bacterium]|nr:hypothetical protein [Clostridia bacterium]